MAGLDLTGLFPPKLFLESFQKSLDVALYTKRRGHKIIYIYSFQQLKKKKKREN